MLDLTKTCAEFQMALSGNYLSDFDDGEPEATQETLVAKGEIPAAAPATDNLEKVFTDARLSGTRRSPRIVEDIRHSDLVEKIFPAGDSRWPADGSRVSGVHSSFTISKGVLSKAAEPDRTETEQRGDETWTHAFRNGLLTFSRVHNPHFPGADKEMFFDKDSNEITREQFSRG